jgi:uncharacterized membrane protein YeaQ/YmgE (transglycosylase-associated protein family)
MYILLWVVVGSVAGWITGQRMKGHGYSPLLDVVMGAAGALGGGYIMRFAGFDGQSGTIYATLVAILSASTVTAVSAFMSGRGRYARL